MAYNNSIQLHNSRYTKKLKTCCNFRRLRLSISSNKLWMLSKTCYKAPWPIQQLQATRALLGSTSKIKINLFSNRLKRLMKLFKVSSNFAIRKLAQCQRLLTLLSLRASLPSSPLEAMMVCRSLSLPMHSFLAKLWAKAWSHRMKNCNIKCLLNRLYWQMLQKPKYYLNRHRIMPKIIRICHRLARIVPINSS